MKCRICGSEAPEGAKLCKDCTAARKRAFAATVTQPLLLAAAGAPSVNPPRFSLKPAKPKNPKPIPKLALARQESAAVSLGAVKARPNDRILVSPAISPLTPVVAPERQTLTPVRQSIHSVPHRLNLRSMLRWLLLAAGIAFAVVLLAIMVTLRRNHPPSEEAQPPLPAATAPATPAATPAAPAEPVAGASAGVAAPEVETTVPPAKPAASRPRRKPVITEDAVKAPKPEPAIVADPTPPNVVAPQRVIDTARPDPLRVLNDALARCARGDLLNRPGCEQQARSQSCGNWWGQIPQCPIGPSTDHGQ